MAVLGHVAANHVDPFYVPFVCQCGAVFKSMVKTSKHMVAKGCMDCNFSVGFDSKIFKLMVAKAPISLGCDEFAMGLRIDSPNRFII